MNQELLKNLHELPEFQVLLKELEKNKPIIPQYDYKSDNIMEVRACLLLKQGYDRAMLIINPFKGEPK